MRGEVADARYFRRATHVYARGVGAARALPLGARRRFYVCTATPAGAMQQRQWSAGPLLSGATACSLSVNGACILASLNNLALILRRMRATQRPRAEDSDAHEERAHDVCRRSLGCPLFLAVAA